MHYMHYYGRKHRKMGNKNNLSTASGGQHVGSTTVFNPVVPFVQKNLRNVVPGKMFYISGIPSANPNRITINFESGQTVAFCFDIRFCFGHNHNVIVRNTRFNDWGQEERALNGAFPFQADKFFDIIILLESSCFKVAVNNQPVTEFVHRTPFNRIDTLSVTGDVYLCQVKF